MTDKEKAPPSGDPKAPEAPVKDAKGRVTNTKMTAKEAAKFVHRMVPKKNDKGEIVRDRDGNPIPVSQAIKEDEVMSFADYDDRVVVVTTAGEKLEGDK